MGIDRSIADPYFDRLDGSAAGPVQSDIPVHERSPPRGVGYLIALMKVHPLRGENAFSSFGCFVVELDP